MLRKYSIRLRETNRQIEQVVAQGGGAPAPAAEEASPRATAGTLQTEALAYFISPSTGTCSRSTSPTCCSGASTRSPA
jgi:hypothetical protein